MSPCSWNVSTWFIKCWKTEGSDLCWRLLFVPGRNFSRFSASVFPSSLHEAALPGTWCDQNQMQGKIILIRIISKTRLFQNTSGLVTVEPEIILQLSIHRQKALANLSLVMVRTTPIGSSWGCPGTGRGQPALTCSPKEKKVRCGNIRRIGRLPDCFDTFAAIWSPGLRLWCGLGHCRVTETHRGTTIWTFSACKFSRT